MKRFSGNIICWLGAYLPLGMLGGMRTFHTSGIQTLCTFMCGLRRRIYTTTTHQKCAVLPRTIKRDERERERVWVTLGGHFWKHFKMMKWNEVFHKRGRRHSRRQRENETWWQPTHPCDSFRNKETEEMDSKSYIVKSEYEAPCTHNTHMLILFLVPEWRNNHVEQGLFYLF